jgi:hypothetical protein
MPLRHAARPSSLSSLLLLLPLVLLFWTQPSEAMLLLKVRVCFRCCWLARADLDSPPPPLFPISSNSNPCRTPHYSNQAIANRLPDYTYSVPGA